MKVAICYADYYIFMVCVRMILTKINDLGLMTSLSYTTIFFSATIIMINAGVHDTLTAYISEFLVQKDFRMVRRTVGISTRMQIALFCIFTVLPSIFVNRIFGLIRVPVECQSETHRLILLLLPAMFVKSLNENFKAFFINLGEIGLTGIITVVSIVPGVISGYLLLGKYRLGLAGIVITITVYSSVSLALMVWKLKTKILPGLKRQEIYPEVEDASALSVGSKRINFLRFGWQSLKFTFTNLIGFILWNALGIMAGMNSVPCEIATFGLFMDITELFGSIFYAIGYLLKMILAHQILSRDPKLVKGQIKKQMMIGTLNGILSAFATLLIL